MKLTRSEQANPQDYFLQSGVDEQGNPIYDLLNQLVDDYLPAKAIRKKVFDGNADIVISADTVHIYWKGDLIAQAQLEGQVETSPSVWQGQFFSFADANIKKIDYRENLPNWLISNFYSLGDEVLHNEINYRCIKSHGYAFYSESSESSSEESASLSSSSEGSSNSSSLSKESMSSSSSSEGSKSSSSSSWSSSSQSSESSISLNQESVEPGITVGWEVYWEQLDPITPFYRAYEVKDVPALGITDAVFGMDVHWAFKDTKLSFYLDAPGFNSRIRWQCRVKDTAVAWTDDSDPENPIYHRGLSFNVSDYEGEVNHGSQADPEPGWTQHWWTFEPDGKQIDAADVRTPLERYEQGVGLVVDPYLTVDEQATYIDVYCDGYVFRAPIDDTENDDFSIRDATNTNEIIRIHNVFWDNSLSYAYYLGYDTNKIVKVIENTPQRVKLFVKGQLDRSSGATQNVLANLDYIELYVTIYPDRYVIDSVWEVSGTITRDASDYFSFNGMVGQTAQLTGENNYYENSGSESEASNSTGYNTDYNYLVCLASEMNFSMQVLYSENWTYLKWNSVDAQFYCNCGVSLSANTYRMITMHVIDSASREGSAKIYDSTDRLAMGDQYKDTTIDDPSKGDWVDDLLLPANIGVDGFASDGSWHLEQTEVKDKKIITTLDTTRIRSSYIVHDRRFIYGSVNNPTDILLCHLKCDEQAASASLNDETANNADGTWSNVSDNSDRNTSTSGDSVQIFGRGRNLDTQNGTGYIEMAVGSGTVHDNNFLKKGSVLISIYPQFGYDDSTTQLIFELIDSVSADGIRLRYYATSDYWFFDVEFGSTEVELYSPAYTESYSLQRPMLFLCCWDSEKDFQMFALDGETIDTGGNDDTPTTNHPTHFYIGLESDDTDPADILIDDVKTFSEAVLPFGAYFIGNGEGLLADIDNPHNDLCFFWDCQTTGSACAKGGSNLATDYTGTNTNGQTISGAALVGTYGWDTNGYTGDILFTVTSADIIDGKKGCLAMWVNVQATDSSQRFFFDFNVDGNNNIKAGLSATNYWFFEYKAGGTTEGIYTSVGPTTGVWYFLKFTWDDSDYVHMFVNEIETGTAQSVAGTFTTDASGTLRIGESSDSCDFYCGRVFISKNPDTPQIWTAFGKPLHIDLVKKNGVYQQYGS